MHLVYRHGLFKVVFTALFSKVFAITPFIGIKVGYHRGVSRAFFTAILIGVYLVDLLSVSLNDEVFILNPFAHTGNEQLPDGVVHLFHNVAPRRPAVAVRHDADRPCGRSPQHKVSTANTVNFPDMRTHLFIQFVVSTVVE